MMKQQCLKVLFSLGLYTCIQIKPGVVSLAPVNRPKIATDLAQNAQAEEIIHFLFVFIFRYDDTSSPSMTSSSMSIDNSGPSSQYGDSVTSHEIESCCCSHTHTPSNPVVPGDRSKLRLHIVNHASPAVEESVLSYMRAELSEELSSLESELENGKLLCYFIQNNKHFVLYL